MSDMGPEVLLGSNQIPERVCYIQADQQNLDLVPVKAHDIRAFAASKAF